MPEADAISAGDGPQEKHFWWLYRSGTGKEGSPLELVFHGRAAAGAQGPAAAADAEREGGAVQLRRVTAMQAYSMQASLLPGAGGIRMRRCRRV